MTSAAMTGSPGFTAKASRKLGRFRAGRLETRQLDRLELILGARRRFEHDDQGVRRSVDARLDHRVIIALAAQQFGQQLGVGARPPVDLRGVGRVLAPLAKRRLLVERCGQLLRRHLFQPLDRDRVAKLGGRIV